MNKDDPSLWISYEKQAVQAWECVSERVNHSLQAEGRSDRIKNIPASGAMVALVEKLISDNGIPGLTTRTIRERLNEVMDDDVHVNEVGWYYLGLVAYSAIYNRSPMELTYRPDDVPETTATALKQLAWNYIRNYKNNYQPKSMTECKTLMTGQVCQGFGDMTGDSVQDCVNLFNNEMYNPFRYNADSDASFWFDVP